jgi:hypothetical protein
VFKKKKCNVTIFFYFRSSLKFAFAIVTILAISKFLWEINVNLRTTNKINPQTNMKVVFEELETVENNSSLACSFGLGRLGNQANNLNITYFTYKVAITTLT